MPAPARKANPTVLLLGENSQGSGYLIHRLEAQKCVCTFAKSCDEARGLFAANTFDLVLSPLRLRDEKTSFFVDLLAGSFTNLFFFQLVEEGCWWLPGLRFGKNCFGSSALRPAEFVEALQALIKEIQMGPPVVLEPQRRLPPPPEPRPSVSLSLSFESHRRADARAANF